MKNIIAIDIGNTCITFGIFKNKKLFKVFKCSSSLNAAELKNFLKKNISGMKNIQTALLCSVVPAKTALLKNLLQKEFRKKTLILNKDIMVPIKNMYKKPEQVGADRLVAAYACKMIYHAPAIIIDFGTATTFDLLDFKGRYLGGLIAPGIQISLDALFKNTALLPKIDARLLVETNKSKSLIGRDTSESIIKGTSYGLSYMCDALIRNIKLRYSKKAKVIATGGLSDFFKKQCKSINIVDKNLILKGIALAFYNS